MLQVLRAFLEADEPLLSSFQWLQLTPPQHSFMEGVARLPRQLLGNPCTTMFARTTKALAKPTQEYSGIWTCPAHEQYAMGALEVQWDSCLFDPHVLFLLGLTGCEEMQK